MPIIAADAYLAAAAFIDGAEEATHEQSATNHDKQHGLCVAYAPHFVA